MLRSVSSSVTLVAGGQIKGLFRQFIEKVEIKEQELNELGIVSWSARGRRVETLSATRQISGSRRRNDLA